MRTPLNVRSKWDRPPPGRQSTWVYDRRANTLTWPGYGHLGGYQIDLDECADARQALDWLLHVAVKTRDAFPDHVYRDLGRAFAELGMWDMCHAAQ